MSPTTYGARGRVFPQIWFFARRRRAWYLLSMTQLLPNAERRLNRSAWPSEALHLQLRHTQEAFGLDALVLADRHGHMWAGSVPDRIHAHLASSVAGMKSLAAGDRFSIAHDAGRSVAVRTLRIGNARLYLAAQGRHRTARPALDRAAAGVERILGALS